MKTILKMTREVYHNFYDDEGNMQDKAIGSFKRLNLSEDRIGFLKRYIEFIMDSDFLSKTVKIYIKTYLTSSSIAAVVSFYNNTHPESEQIKIKNAQSATDYASNNLIKIFDDDMLIKVLGYSNCNLEQYINQLNLVIAENIKNKSLTDSLIIKLPRVEIKKLCTDEEFEQLIFIITPYFKKCIKNTLSKMPESLGYLQFIMSTPVENLSIEDKERVQLIEGFLENRQVN